MDMKYKNPFVDESAFEGDEGPKKSEDEVLMEEAKQHTEVQVVETYMALGMVIGLAAGAATVGCCAQMIGFAVQSFRAKNGVGKTLSVAVGTSMLYWPNILKKPSLSNIR